MKDFLKSLKAANVKAEKAWRSALEVYDRAEVEAAMKEVYPDFKIPADSPAPAVKPEAASSMSVADAMKAENKRRSEIKAAGKILGIDAEIIEKTVDDGATKDEANTLFIANKASTALSADPTIKVGVEDSEKFQNIATKSLLDAAGLVRDQKVRDEVKAAGLEIAPRSIHGLFRSVLRKNGMKGVDNMVDAEIVDSAIKFYNSNAQGTGDFANILANVGNKSFARGIEEAPTTYRVWTRQKPVKNFQQISMASLSSFSDVDVMLENAAPKYGSFSDKKEVGTLRTSGKIYTISRQAMVNDDLGAFTEIPRKMGIAIERAKEKECYDYLYGTTSYGPTMNEDSGTLFNATAVTTAGGHANLTTSGGAPTKTTLDVGILAIMTAPCIKGNPADATQVTGAMPRFLIAPAALASTVWDLTAPMNAPLGTYISGPNPFATGGRCPLTPVISAYLNSVDANGWYLATDPNEIGTIAMLTLMGKSGPSFTQEDNAVGAPLGMSFLIYDDWRFVAEDWRGMYCNDGE